MRINPQIKTVGLMDPAEAVRLEFIIGYVGPHAVDRQPLTRVIADYDAAQDKDWVTGANEKDYHVRHFNWARDVIDEHDVVVCDIRNAVEGDPSPRNDGGVLHVRKGIEIGHVFKLGTKYTKAMNVTVLNEKNERAPMIMGCYGIGINRILASAIERDSPGKKGHDENGIIWPAAIAPYQVVITPIKYDGTLREAADKLAAALEASGGGADVIIDDRDERPGVKFKDADLLGFPVRITIGEKSLAAGQVEVKARNAPAGSKADLVAVDGAVAKVVEMLKTL
jgi:prolyl-tRNA synthetase